ncbi:MAG: methionine synthase [Geodermatophilaceae bacterium]|nr:methionine synthase [Geodermatophilaceae bacterium]
MSQETARSTEQSASATLPMLPTTVVGSYSVPEWLERLKTDFYLHRISPAHLAEIHDVAIKAAIKDQEQAGIDVVSDGELRRDNDIDYLLARIPGVSITDTNKAYYYDYYDAEVPEPLATSETSALGLVDDFVFTRGQTDRPIKFSFTGPFSLSRRIRKSAYSNRADLVRSLARALNAEARELVAAGATRLQIDEPFLAGYPDDAGLAIEAINLVTEDVEADWALHVCYGNRYARPSWEGHYDFLFPAVLDAEVGTLVLEFARKGYGDLALFKRYPWERRLGLGVIDVKSEEVETSEIVAARIRRALEVVPPERLIVNPDCGLRHLPAFVARAKLKAMVAGAAAVRQELSQPKQATAEPSAPALTEES